MGSSPNRREYTGRLHDPQTMVSLTKKRHGPMFKWSCMSEGSWRLQVYINTYIYIYMHYSLQWTTNMEQQHIFGLPSFAKLCMVRGKPKEAQRIRNGMLRAYVLAALAPTRFF